MKWLVARIAGVAADWVTWNLERPGFFQLIRQKDDTMNEIKLDNETRYYMFDGTDALCRKFPNEVVASPVLEPTEDNPSGSYWQIQNSTNGTKTAVKGDYLKHIVFNGNHAFQVYPKSAFHTRTWSLQHCVVAQDNPLVRTILFQQRSDEVDVIINYHKRWTTSSQFIQNVSNSGLAYTALRVEDAETNEIVDIRLPDIFHEMYSKHSIAYRMHEKDQEIIKLFNWKALVESDKKFRTDIAYVDGVVESTSKTPDDEVDASKQQVLTRLREQLIKSEEEAGCLDDLSDNIGESNDKLRKENSELRERIAKLENFFNNVVHTATTAVGPKHE